MTNSNGSEKDGARTRARLLLLIAGLAGLGVLVGFLLEDLYRGRTTLVGGAGSAETARAGGQRARSLPFLPSSPGSPASAPADIPPWESTPENTPDPGPGLIPAWQLKPPPPEPMPPPPPPVEPPDPQQYRPPMHNPGGVNGDRPPRKVPGLE